MPTWYSYSMAAMLALLVLLNTANLVVGVLAIVTGKSYYPRVIQRLSLRWTPASPDDQRLRGMSIVLNSVAGLVVSFQLGLLLVFLSMGSAAPHTPAVLAGELVGNCLMFFVGVLLIGASLVLHVRTHFVDRRPNRPSPDANLGPQST
jgi:hypothetical protein